MALPEGYKPKEYLPTEQDFAKVLAAKQNGNYFALPWCPQEKDAPYYYPTIRIYLAAILLKWEEFGKNIEQSLLQEGYSYINGVKTLTQRFTKQDLTIIRAFAVQYKQYYLNSYVKYKDAGQELESPEKRRQAARNARKGEIEVKTKGTDGLFRIIPYSMKYGDEDPAKRQAGARMHLFFGKDIGGKYNIVVRGSTISGEKKDAIFDTPYFATEQEARNFIANINHTNIKTKVTIEDWRYVISNRPISDGYIRNSDGTYSKAWITFKIRDAIQVQTTCGPAYMLKGCQLLKKTNMKEAIEKHETLNPKLFDNDIIKPEIRKKAEDVVNEFLKILAEDEVKLKVRDVILTGSNASYNYTANSDVDLHILADTAQFDDPEQLHKKLYNCYRRLFESKFDITFYGIPVEVYVETEDNPVVSNGIYSVMYDRWVKEPTQDYVKEIDQKEIAEFAKPWIDRAKEVIKKVDNNIPDDEEEIDKYLEDIYEMRQKGIYNTDGSEFSPENLAFKEVRNAGLLDKLKDLKNRVIEKRLSLEEGIKYLDDDHEFKDFGTEDAHEKDVIDTRKASTFETQDLLDSATNSAYDSISYEIVEMTPTQYFELCGKLQGKKPDEIIDFIGADKRQLTHIKDVILKYGKKLPLPYVSFSSVDEVSGQEGRHRMYALGEMFGWDEDFPVMLIQDASSKKTLGELLHESIMEDFQLDEKTRRDYAVKIAQIAHDQPIVHPNGMFELHNVSEQDTNFIIQNLRCEPWVEYVSKSGGKYDYSKMSYQGIPALKLNITGKIKFN